MEKFKVINKKNQSFLMLKSQKGQQLNYRETEELRNGKIDGLLPVEVKHGRNSFKLTYNTTGLINFSQYLQGPTDKESFSLMIKNIYEQFKMMEAGAFYCRNLILDFKYIYINPIKKKFYFIYIPIEFYNNLIPLKDFYLEIATKSKFLPDEDTTYISEFISIFNSKKNFSDFELAEYIKKISSNEEYTENKTCIYCGKKNLVSATFCTSCSKSFSKIKSDINTVYQPQDRMQSYPETSETSVLGNNSETTVLGSGELTNYPKLIRVKTKESIEVNTSVFRLGRERSVCNYTISDNTAISRSHADIVLKNGNYYIVDHNSANKTYLNGKMLNAETDYELQNEAKIKLANEEFLFKK